MIYVKSKDICNDGSYALVLSDVCDMDLSYSSEEMVLGLETWTLMEFVNNVIIKIVSGKFHQLVCQRENNNFRYD